MSVSIALILDTRRQKENNKFPIKIRVNFKRVTNYYPTMFDLTQPEYDKLTAPRISAELQTIKTELKKIEREAEEALSQMDDFSFYDFENRFIVGNPLFQQRKRKTKPVNEVNDGFDFTPFQKKFPILLERSAEPGSLTFSYQAYIKKLLKEGRISTAVNYHCSYVSLKKFQGNVRFSSITAAYLHAYEQHVKANGLSRSTIGIYLRPLRAIYNEAIEAGFAKGHKSYPFGRRKYQIPSGRNVKKALDLTELEKIYYYDEGNLSETEKRARAYWLFSYFANGMNPKDIASLKYSNIHDEYIIFERAKTQRSLRDDPKPITVFLNDDMKAIISRWGNRPALPFEYIFPILYSGVTPLRQYTLICNLVRGINDAMQKILDDLGIKKKVTTYVARHTFSTILKRSGASTEQIQEALGHTNMKTTESYLDSFDKETKKQLASQLTSFKRQQKPSRR
jgi:integrase/recombinase XerD